MIFLWVLSGVIGLILEVAAVRYVEEGRLPPRIEASGGVFIMAGFFGPISLAVGLIFCCIAIVTYLKKRRKKNG